MVKIHIETSYPHALTQLHTMCQMFPHWRPPALIGITTVEITEYPMKQVLEKVPRTNANCFASGTWKLTRKTIM